MARKQEQEPARDEVREVAPDVLRVELPIQMPGLGHVNMYVLTDSEGAAVVDPGLPGRATWKVIGARLRQAGLRIRDVHTVVITHSHPDHFGGAERFAKEAGATIVAHRSFRFGPFRAQPEPEVSVDDLAAHHHGTGQPDAAGEATDASSLSPHPHPQSQPSLGGWSSTTPWGGPSPRPPLRVRLKWRLLRAGGARIVPAITRPVTQGDVLKLAGRDWFVVHTPGHTEDHFCLHDPERGVFLAGDHVLPTITPHISGLSHAADPLDSFFESLDRVAAIPDVSQVLPAHGHPFCDLSARAEAIKRHHHERLARVVDIGRELGPARVEAFSKQLFRQRSWGSMAESETYAHLEHLLHAGKASRRPDTEGFLVYETG